MRNDPLVDILLEGAVWSFPLAVDRPGASALLQRAGYQASPESQLFERLWPLASDRTLLDQFRAESVLHHAQGCLGLDGDLVEFGAFQGGMSILLALLAREHGHKKVHICDSFEGLPAPDPTRDGQYRQGEFRGDLDGLRTRLRELDLEEWCVIHHGWFEDTLPRMPAGTTFCFAYVDCDLYRPALLCLDFLATRMPRGAAITLDDYFDGHGGAMDALEEHVARTGEVIQVGPAPQASIRLGVVSPSPPVLRFDDVKALASYQAFLREALSANPPNAWARQFADLCGASPGSRGSPR